MNIGKNIKEKRILKKMSLEDLAKKVDVTRQTVHRYETGEINNIPSDRIESIATALNVNPSYLMGWQHETLDDKIREMVISIINWLDIDIDTIHLLADGKISKESFLKFKTNEDTLDYGFLIDLCKAFDIDLIAVMSQCNLLQRYTGPGTSYYDNLNENHLFEIIENSSDYSHYIIKGSDINNLNEKQNEIIRLTDGLTGKELDEIIEFIIGKELLKQHYNK